MAKQRIEKIEFIKTKSDTEVLIDINSLGFPGQDYQNAIMSLTDNSIIKSLVIKDELKFMTEGHAQILLSFLQKPEQASFAINITLPEHLAKTRIQIELDNLISNRRLEQNIKRLTDAQPQQEKAAAKGSEARVLPEGKTKPKIEIILSDEDFSETAAPVSAITSDKTPTFKGVDSFPKLERSPMAEQLVLDILDKQADKTAKGTWEKITDRNQALAFRRDHFALLKGITIENHPLHLLLRDNKELQQQLKKWTDNLKLGKEQYDALLDVCGQYGSPGLARLFQTWEGYNPEELAAFKETHTHLLKHMPTYLPFIEDKAFQGMINKISILPPEKRSWWMALIQNHGSKPPGYSDLPSLFKCFTEATVAIGGMGLQFYKIDAIKDKRDLPSVLSDMLTLLKQCPAHDRKVQWECMSGVDVSRHEKFRFIIPEMKIEDTTLLDLENGVKSLLGTKPVGNPELLKPAFYRYLAAQKQHLPLEQYQQILESLKNSKLADEIKLRMIYVLAKTTSTTSDEGFDPISVKEEWDSFKDRIEKLEYMKRIKANRGGLALLALEGGLKAMGGDDGVRIKALIPLMSMPTTPPMSFLNKLLKLSEYKFLDENLILTGMDKVKDEMMLQMNKAAELYGANPKAMMQAIRLIKTETVKANEKGKFFPAEEDKALLEQFVLTCDTLTKPENNTLIPEKLNPKQVILPLLTLFHLEYENQKDLVEKVIKPYIARMNAAKTPEDKENIKYGLSLLQKIKNREQPSKLTLDTLNKIQEGLVGKISQPKMTQKKIREWMHENYHKYFDGNELLDIKDKVEFTPLFEKLGCTQPTTCKAIEDLVGMFDNEKETGDHEDLAKSLVALEKSLTPDQKARFFEFCQEAFKTEGLLSRSKNEGPPNCIKQFVSLVKTITDLKSFDQFEQYMNVAKEYSLKKGEDKNNLAKCDYLLSTLYPALIQKGHKGKEVFNFAAELVCRSPLEIEKLDTLYKDAKIAEVNIEPPTELILLKKEIEEFNRLEITTPEDLAKLQKKIGEVIALRPGDERYFKGFRKIRTDINDITAAIAKRNDEYDKKSWVQRLTFRVQNPISSYTRVASEKEREDLKGALQFELEVKYEGTSEKPTIENEIGTIKNKQFQHLAINLQVKKASLIKKYSNLSTRANDFISMALDVSPSEVSKNHNDTCKLIDDLIELDNQNLVFSLMYRYAGGLPDRGVKDLIELFNTDEYKGLKPELRKDFVNAIISQMNNGVKLKKEGINEFLKFVCENQKNPFITKCLHDYYQHAPFPQLSTFIAWTKLSKDKMQEEMQKAYQHFDKHPCAISVKYDGREKEKGDKLDEAIKTVAKMPEVKKVPHDGREKENGFKLDKAKEIVANMPEVQHIFTPDNLNAIHNSAAVARHMSTKQILKKLNEFKAKPPANHIEMVMLTAELLHRSKGLTPEFRDTEERMQVPGRSFELNTTQIMAILSTLESGKKVTAGIGTGEGKSRIMMVLNACQFIKGNTVDFVTSNLALAERDYLAALPFFTSLGAEVNFITASSKIADYKIGGINVTDPENLCLFRNKAFSQKKSAEVMDPDPKKRALLLDEADVMYFDVASTKYNYSSSIPQVNIDLLPLYPRLMEFFAESTTEETYRTNKQLCNARFLAFLEPRNPSLFEIVKKAPIAQLEKWLDAAYNARRLEYNVDYSIVTDAMTPTALGNKKVAAAMCHIGSSINENAKFPDGVHQCLHAELNRLMKAEPSATPNESLREALAICKDKGRVFNIDPERQITFSGSSNTMLKLYDKGSINALTGTPGSDMEKRDAQTDYGTKFINVPRHKGMKRNDRPTRITLNEEQQLDALVDHILDARAKKQPVLLICKNDEESKRLNKKLEDLLKDKRVGDLPKLTRIHATTDREKNFSEADYIKEEAGKPGHVTITTEKAGRGVDIELKDDAHYKGLKVLLTYLPRGERDYGQIIGRSGRYGAVGDSQMVLNLEELKREFKINHLNDDYYRNPEAFIRRLQMFASHTNDLRRLFNKAYDNLLREVTDRYTTLLSLSSGEKESELKAAWSLFLGQYQSSKDNTYPAILNQLEQNKPDVELIKAKLNDHNKDITTRWSEFIQSVKLDPKHLEKIAPLPEMERPKLLDKWLGEMQKLKTDYVTVKEKIEVKVMDEYDPEKAGQVQILKDPANQPGRELFANFFAALRGEGKMFPNLRAKLAKEISWTNFLSQLPGFNRWFKPESETKVIEQKVPSTYAMLYSELEADSSQDKTATQPASKKDPDGSAEERVDKKADEKAEESAVKSPVKSPLDHLTKSALNTAKGTTEGTTVGVDEPNQLK